MRILQEQYQTGKPVDGCIPAKIPPNWVRAGSLISSILADAGAAGDKAELEEKLCEGALL